MLLCPFLLNCNKKIYILQYWLCYSEYSFPSLESITRCSTEMAGLQRPTGQRHAIPYWRVHTMDGRL